MENVQSTISAMYKRSAEHGVVLGVYMTAIFLAMTAGVTNHAFSLLVLVLMAGAPLVVYRWLRQVYCREEGQTDFSALWMEGIATFFFGGVLSSFFAFVYMQAIDPAFIENMMRLSIDTYRQNPWEGGDVIADGLQTAIDNHMVPSAISLVADGMWLIVFSGSMLSMILALLVRIRPVKNNKM